MSGQNWGREIAIAGLAGGVFAASPLLPPATWTRLLGGLGLACAVLAWRVKRGHAAAGASATGLEARELAAAATAALLLLAFGPALRWMYEQWTHSVWINNHGIFIPFVVAYMVWDVLKHFRGEEATGHAAGIALIVIGLVLSAIDTSVQTHYLGILGLFIAGPGFALAVLGVRRTIALRYAFVVALMMIPVPFSLGTPLMLRDITAIGVEQLLHAGGVAVFREGTVLHLARHQFIVADACSGFSTLYASIAMALILTVHTKVTWRRFAILGAAIPFAIAANILRVLLLVVVSLVFGSEILETPIHEGSGVAVFFLVIVGLGALAGSARGRGTAATAGAS